MQAADRTAGGSPTPIHPPHLLTPPGLPWDMPGPKAKGEAVDLIGSLVRDVMTQKVVTVEITDTLRFATTLLAQKAISGVPVLGKDGKVVGVLSEKDVLKVLKEKAGLETPGGLFGLILETSEARQKDLLSRCRAVLDDIEVAAAMTSPAHTIGPDAPSLEAIRQMVVYGINRMPVLDRGQLVGIVTRRDVLRFGQSIR
jgi:CBS domain-containing protein